MLKKIIIGSAIAAAGTGLVMGTSALSYMKMAAHSVKQGIQESIPIEVEIKRARDMIADLKPEIADNLQLIAREEVEVARLTKEVGGRQELLAKSKRDILRLKDDLQDKDARYVYAGRHYSEDQVRDNLASRFKQYQTQEATTSKMEKILEAREKNLEACRRKLDEMLAAKRQLEVEVENMQARLTMVQVAETSSQMAINDSQLSQTRQLLDTIRTRIDVAEKMVNSEGILDGNIQLEEETPSDLLEQITAYFSDGSSNSESLVRN